MKDDLLFINAVAKAKENTLFTEERLNRMANARDINEAVRILTEANYGGGLIVDDALDYEKILAAEYARLNEFLRSVPVKDIGFECFYIKSDYHNVKALLKAFYQGENAEHMLLPGGFYDIKELGEKLKLDDLNINPYIDEAVKEIRKTFANGVKSPRLIDILLDKAMYKDIANRLASKNVDRYVKDYFTLFIDCINVSLFVRSAAIGAKPAFFVSNFIEGGSITHKTLIDFYPSVQKLSEYLRYTPAGKLAQKINEKDMSSFDTARDNMLLDIFKENKHDVFSVAPSMGYYLAKINEIQTIRVVLVCIKNGVDRAEIKKRMRLMYA